MINTIPTMSIFFKIFFYLLPWRHRPLREGYFLSWFFTVGEGTVGLNTCISNEKFSLKPGWSPIRELGKPTSACTQNTFCD